MKKALFFAFAACAMMSASAHKIVTKNTQQSAIEQRLEKQVQLSDKAQQLRKTLAGQQFSANNTFATTAKKAPKKEVEPKGELRYYELDGFMNTMFGMFFIEDMAAPLYFDNDGSTIYFSSLFPMSITGVYSTGHVDGDKVTFSKDESIYTADYGEDGLYDLIIAELILDEEGNVLDWKDLQFEKDGDHIYFADELDEEGMPQRYIGLMLISQNNPEDCGLYDYGCLYDYNLYEGNTDLAVVPESATVGEYIYTSTDDYGMTNVNKGMVAIDGDDYYFDSFFPALAPALVKGVREGNTITVPAGQFLGADSGYYLYFNGFHATGFDEETYEYIGENVDLTFSVSEDGTISLENPDDTFPTATMSDGYLYDISYDNVIAPYAGDVPLVPSDPYDVLIMTDYYEAFGQYAVDFTLDNVSADGKYLNPACLSYRFYIDGELYTFSADDYPYIEETMDLVPYGYNDLYGYDFYCSGAWNEIYLYEDMFETVGVQAVYTVDGVTNESNIVTVDMEGNVEIIAPEGGDDDTPDTPVEPGAGWDGTLGLPETAATLDALTDYTVQFNEAASVKVANTGVLAAVFDENGEPYAIAFSNRFGSVEAKGDKLNIKFEKIADIKAALAPAAMASIAKIAGAVNAAPGEATVFICGKSAVVDGQLYADNIVKSYTLDGKLITGIAAAQTQTKASWYDLAGRQAKASAHGIMINAGKIRVK